MLGNLISPYSFPNVKFVTLFISGTSEKFVVSLELLNSVAFGKPTGASKILITLSSVQFSLSLESEAHAWNV